MLFANARATDPPRKTARRASDARPRPDDRRNRLRFLRRYLAVYLDDSRRGVLRHGMARVGLSELSKWGWQAARA